MSDARSVKRSGGTWTLYPSRVTPHKDTPFPLLLSVIFWDFVTHQMVRACLRQVERYNTFRLCIY